MALVMAIGITSVLGIAGATAVAYSTSGAQESQQSGARQNAFSLAGGRHQQLDGRPEPADEQRPRPGHAEQVHHQRDEVRHAGLDPDKHLGSRHDSYANGTVDWCGTLNRSTAQWYLTSIGNMKNPGRTGNVTRMLQATVSVVPTLTQPLNNPSWNYIYATHTGNACDQTLSNNVGGGSWMYVAGNLCLSQNVGIGATKLIVGGNLDLDNNAFVGANTSMATRAEAYVGGNCRYQKVSSTWHACTGNQDGYNIFSKLSDGSTIGVNHIGAGRRPARRRLRDLVRERDPRPGLVLHHLERHAARRSTATTRAATTASPRPFDLTPASSYTCRVGPGANTTVSSAMTAAQTTITVPSATGFPATGTFRIRVDDENMTVTAGAGTTTWTITRGVNGTSAATHAAGAAVYWDDADTSGEISWNSTSKTLTVKGTIFIDGSAKISQNANYNGQATLYLSGTMLFNGSLCGVPTGSSCVFANWNPNLEMLTIVANGTGGQVNAGDSVLFANNQYFQGGLFGDRERRVRQQRELGRADHGLADHPGQQRGHELVPEHHDRAGRDAGEPRGLRAAEPAAVLQRLSLNPGRPPADRADVDVALGLFAFWPALALGSFLNVVAARVPLRRSVVRPALGLHELRHRARLVRQRAGGLVARAARPLPLLRRPHQRASTRPSSWRRPALVAGCFVKFGPQRRGVPGLVLLRRARRAQRDRPRAPDRPEPDRPPGSGDRAARADRAPPEPGVGARRARRLGLPLHGRARLPGRAWAWATSSSRCCSARCSAGSSASA